MAAPTTMHFHSLTFIHTFHLMGGVFVIVLYITSLSTNESGRYFLSLCKFALSISATVITDVGVCVMRVCAP